MIKRKTIISVKRGLSEDPKHRETMGNRIWLFLHILDRADWETGKVFDWRDGDEANDMAMPWRTLQKQRQELAEQGYISCAQTGDKQTITIFNWVNPRNYSGEIINPKGTLISVPLTEEGTHEGTQPSNRDLGTPPLDKIKDQRSATGTPPVAASSLDGFGITKKYPAVEINRKGTAEALTAGTIANDSLTAALTQLTGTRLTRPTKTEQGYINDLREDGAIPNECAKFHHYWTVVEGWRGPSSKPTLKQVWEKWQTVKAWQPTDARPAAKLPVNMRPTGGWPSLPGNERDRMRSANGAAK